MQRSRSQSSSPPPFRDHKTALAAFTNAAPNPDDPQLTAPPPVALTVNSIQDQVKALETVERNICDALAQLQDLQQKWLESVVPQVLLSHTRQAGGQPKGSGPTRDQLAATTEQSFEILAEGRFKELHSRLVQVQSQRQGLISSQSSSKTLKYYPNHCPNGQ